MKHVYIAAALVMLLGITGCSNSRKETLDIQCEEDLSGLTLAVSNGSYYHTKYSKREDVKTFVTNTDADAIQAVRQGLADVFVSDEVMLTAEDQARLGMKIAFRGDEAFDVAFSLRKGDDELRNKLNDFLANEPLDGIIDHWINGAPAVEKPEYDIPADAAPLRCICCLNLSPISYIGDGGQWIGLEPEILERFAHSIGRPFEMQYQVFTSAIVALQAGQADIVSSCLFVTEERKKSVDFSNPYYKCRPGYFIADRENDTRMTLGERLKMNLVTEKRWKLITDGLLETIKITLLSILLGTFLGIGVCICRRSRRKWLRGFASFYGAFINGIPVLVLLLIMFYVVFANTGIGASLVAIITFGLCFASSSGSIFDTAISSVPAGQMEAGLALGFTPFRTFNGIVVPQALKRGLPLFASDCVSLLKSTSIVGYISIQDVTRASDLIRSRTFDAFIPLLIITILYFVLAWLIRKLLKLFLIKK